MTDPVATSAHEWRPKRFMLITAHPDDADFGPAATAAKWIDAGSAGWLVCCTSGDQGGEDPDLDPMRLALTREEEQRRAAAVVGYEGLTFLHQPDGALANDLALREQLVREIRTFRPDAVLTHDPSVVVYARGGINHTDHRAAGKAAVDAVYPAARNPMAFPHLARAGLALQRVRRMYLFWPNEPDTWVDVSGTIERKIRALREHPSQLKRPEDLDDRIIRSAAETALAIGVAAAEAFRLVVIDEDEEEGPTDEALEPSEAPEPTGLTDPS
jgi:LmbE family N-acetylglucosaminyl deacetylase